MRCHHGYPLLCASNNQGFHCQFARFFDAGIPLCLPDSMSAHIRKALIALASAGALVAATFAPAHASGSVADLIGGGKPPASWIIDPDVYSDLFGPLAEGAPQGTIVVDSGFRPYPHGFPLPNWGSAGDFVQNQAVYGAGRRVSLEQIEKNTATLPEPMNALSLRRTFGDGVCRDPRTIDPRTGSCELIFGAELLAQLIETQSQGGHCFGMAAAAAALYNGQIPPNQAGASGLGINAGNPMEQPAVQTITRLFGTQFFNPGIAQEAASGMTPTQVVNTLIRDLAGGTVPYILTVIGEIGGHGITPYAVLDRGDGVFDIAVYDNNFPMRALAVTVDTKDDSFTYSSALNPATSPLTWDSANGSVLGLISVSDTLEVQPCPVCLGPDQGTLLTITSLNADNIEQIGLVLVDKEGKPLDENLYTAIAPLNPPTQRQVSMPVIQVAPGVDFGVAVQTGQLASKQSLEIYAISNGKANYLLLDELRDDSISVFEVRRDTGGAKFQSDKPSSPRVLQLSDEPRVSFDVNGHPLNLPAGVTVNQNWNTDRQRVVYSSNAKRTLRWNVQIGGLSNAGGKEYVGLNVAVPAGARIVIDYSNASTTVAPQAWVQTRSGARTPIRMQALTEQLINAYRSELYVSRGPAG